MDQNANNMTKEVKPQVDSSRHEKGALRWHAKSLARKQIRTIKSIQWTWESQQIAPYR